MVTSDTVVEIYNQASQRPINHFYKKYKQNVSACSSDLIFIARLTQGINNNFTSLDIVGAALVRNLGSKCTPLYLFRSLFIAPSYRGRQLGRSITSYSEKYLANSPLYTLCEDNLIEFYRSLNFIICRQTPTELAKLSAKKNLTLMVRF